MDSERGTAITDIDRLTASLSTVLEGSLQDVIVEGHLAPHVLDDLPVELAYVLRCDPDELVLRLRKRGFPELKALENAASEILGICLWDAVERFGRANVAEIDTTSCSPEHVVEEMADILSGRSEHVVGRVDWLSAVSEQGRLSYFFR
jgi:adenylate kinase